MSKIRRWCSHGSARIALLLLFSVPLAGAIDEQEFACEEALKHVEDCCPNAPRQFSCGEGCSDVGVGYAEADCLRNAPCSEIIDSGVCDPYPVLTSCK